MNLEDYNFNKTNNGSGQRGYVHLLVNAVFVIYFFFIFYGTTVPFREKIENADEIGTSNTVNQIVFGSLFLISVLTLIPKWKYVKRMIQKEKLFSIFLLWAFCSIFWSAYPDVSLKRYIQYLTTFTVFYSTLIYTNNPDSLNKYFKILLSAFVLISMISVFTIPGAKDQYGIWKGLAPSKNHLGIMCVITIILFTKFFNNASLKYKPFYLTILLITVVLFIESNSITSLSTVIILVLIYLVIKFNQILKPLNFGRFFSIFTIICLGAAIFVGFLILPDAFLSIFNESGRDLTLTGRTDLWKVIILFIQQKLFLGWGFQGFWVVGSPQTTAIYEIFTWLPIQAHNGYLDIINETGLVGLSIFILLIGQYFKYWIKSKSNSSWNWLVIAALIINLTESTLIRPNVSLGCIFIFSYLLLFSEIVKKEISQEIILQRKSE